MGCSLTETLVVGALRAVLVVLVCNRPSPLESLNAHLAVGDESTLLWQWRWIQWLLV